MNNTDFPKGTHQVLSMPPLSTLRIFWKRRWLLLSIWAFLSMSAAIGTRQLPYTYRAEALVLFDSQKIPERYGSPAVNTEVQERLAAISQRILSFSHLQELIDDFGLYQRDRRNLSTEELIERLRRDITIKLERGWTGARPGAFRIGYSGEDPHAVAQVVNQLGFMFADENVRTREVQAVGAEEFIVAQLAEAKRTLDQLEAKVSQYKLSHNGELPDQQQSIANTLAQLRSALDANHENSNRVQEVKIALENNLNLMEINRQGLEKSLAGKTQPDSALPRQRPQSELLQERYANMLKRYSPEHPDALALRRAIEAATDEERSGTQHTIAIPAPVQKPAATAEEALQLERTREHARKLRSQISQAEKELVDRKAEQDRILKEIASCQERLRQLPVREQEIAQLSRDYENSRSNYRMLLDKKLSAEMATAMEFRQKSERFTILDPARTPTKPISPNRPLLFTGGCLLALALSAGLILLLESRKPVFLGEWELPEGVAVLGRLPAIEVSPALHDSEKPRSGRRRSVESPTTMKATPENV